MPLIDFLCHIDGDVTLPKTLVKIPDVCCGIQTIALTIGGNPATYITSGCPIHLGTHKDIWDMFSVPVTVPAPVPTPVVTTPVVPTTPVVQAYSQGFFGFGMGFDWSMVGKVKVDTKGGATCDKCKVHNEYAVANKPNDIFICWACEHPLG